MFAALKTKLTSGAKRMQGKTDMLEAVCAASALVAAADGSIEDSEIEAMAKAVSANEILNTAFSAREIEGSITRMIDRANGGRVGQMGLYREIEEVAADPDAELVLMAALDIAEADGAIDDKETAVLEKVATKLGLKLSSYA